MNNIEELNIEYLKINARSAANGVAAISSKWAGETMLALIAQLEAKNIRADACVNAFEGIETERFAGKSIGEFLAGEVRLNKAEPKPDGSFGFTFSGLAIQIMAESFADQFKSSGAVNYLELLFDHSEVGPLTVTMQRVDGLTPAQKLATAEAALSAANERLKVPAGHCIMPKSLTAENGAKGALSGEFFTETHITCEECGGDCDEDDPCEHCNDLGVQTVRTAIGWSTIKDIYKMAVSATAIRQSGFTVEGDATPIVIVPAPAGVIMRPQSENPLERCAAGRDGECHHKDCPQLRDNEPMATGRHCPIDNWDDE